MESTKRYIELVKKFECKFSEFAGEENSKRPTRCLFGDGSTMFTRCNHCTQNENSENKTADFYKVVITL